MPVTVTEVVPPWQSMLPGVADAANAVGSETVTEKETLHELASATVKL